MNRNALNRRSLLAAVLVVVLVLLVMRTQDLRAIAGEGGIRTALVYTPDDVGGNPTHAAYEESFREAGVPFTWIASTDISLFGADALHRMYAAIVFPDGLNRQLSEEAILELRHYAAEGGEVAIVNDAGTRSGDGSYRPASLFAAVSGVDALLYQQLRDRAFTSGPLHFAAESDAERWQVPYGKLVRNDLSSYLYGPVAYPFARANIVSDDVAVDAADGTTPLITRRDLGNGEVSYIALPIGYLREHSDAFPMSLLFSVLTSRDQLPHMIASPDGVGELIINLQIDSAREYLGIPNLRERGLLRPAVRMEFDVTAGPDLQHTGDGLGFDACGRGRQYLQTLMRYGRIGSDGGWTRNAFAHNVENGRLSFQQIRSLVDRNDRCLESVTRKPVLSYAAPAGIHPQPLMTNVLDDLGIRGYYYADDTGAPVERPFYDGQLVSNRSWAFPIMPFRVDASIAEMRERHVPPIAVQGWLDRTAAYAAARHGIYLIYSHPDDLLAPDYASAFGHFLDRVEALQHAGTLHATDMPAAAAFMDRFVGTTETFTRDAGGVHVMLHNDQGLRSIAFALPARWLVPNAAVPAGIRRTATQGGYAIFAITNDAVDFDVTFPGVST